MRKLMRAWRYYTLNRDDYIKCINADAMSNLKLMGITGILFAAIAVFAAVNFIRSASVIYYFIPSVIFFGLAAVSLVYAIVALRRYERYKRVGSRVQLKWIYVAMVLGYAVIVLSTIYTEVWVAPQSIPVVFVALVGGAILLLPPNPLVNSLLTLAMAATYFISSYTQIEPECCWVREWADTVFGVVISVVLTWYINMHKLVATHSTILMRDERDKYATRSLTDELTKLHNYRDFMNRLERYLNHYRASDKYMCLAVMDIDRFKQYNDHYGHPQGDECLRLIGEALGKPWAENPGMYVARIGGEEFALLWFEEDKGNAKKVAEEIHRRICELQITHEMSDIAPYVTFSVGIDISHSGSYGDTRAAYSAADGALYDAKENGRNNAVIMFEGERILRLKQPILKL